MFRPGGALERPPAAKSSAKRFRCPPPRRFRELSARRFALSVDWFGPRARSWSAENLRFSYFSLMNSISVLLCSSLVIGAVSVRS